MPFFSYEVLDDLGKVCQGTLDARSERHALKKLEAKGYDVLKLLPLQIEETVPLEPPRPFLPPAALQVLSLIQALSQRLTKLFHSLSCLLPVSREEVILFVRQITAMYQAGLPLLPSVEAIGRGQREGRFKKLLQEMAQDLEKGSSLSEAMGKHRRTFSPLNLGLMKAGEEGGVLGRMLERIAFHEERDLHLVRQVKAAMTYPLVVFAGAVTLVFLLMNYLFANLLVTISQLGVALPFSTMLLLGFARFLKDPVWLGFSLAVLVSVAFGIRSFLRTPRGMEYRDLASMKFPVGGVIVRKVISARFCRALGTLYECGVPLMAALEAASEATGNTLLTKEVRERLPRVGSGALLSDGIFSASLFLPMVRQMVKSGEESGELAALLFKVAEFYESEIAYALDTFTATIEPFMIGVLGLLVGFIMIATLSPLYGIISTFSR